MKIRFFLAVLWFVCFDLQAVDCVPDDIALESQQQVDDFQLLYGPCESVVDDLRIRGEDIADLDGLTAVTRIGGEFAASFNPQLTDIGGVAAIAYIGETLWFGENPLLQNCSALQTLVDRFDDAEPGPGGPWAPDVGHAVVLNGNGAGCNSIGEIITLIGFDGFEEQDLPALEALYESTNGDDWNSNDNWWAGDHCTNNWFGVSCDGTGKVQQVSLLLNNLTGTIPPEIADLQRLNSLELYDNLLTGEIPESIGRLSQLRFLGLSGNPLEGTLPPSLGNLSQLEGISVSYSTVHGQIPAVLGALENLRGITLHDNDLSGPIPSELGALLELTHLKLANNQLSGPIPETLGSAIMLEYLLLENNQLIGPLPEELGNLPNIQGLEINGNAVTGEVPGSFINLDSLNSIDLAYNGLRTDDPALDAFLDTKSFGDWSATQTVAPSNVAVSATTNQSITLTWDPIEYAADAGGYSVWISEVEGGPYLLAGETFDKTVSELEITGLESATTYYLIVRTETDPHPNNANSILSQPSDEVSGMTL